MDAAVDPRLEQPLEARRGAADLALSRRRAGRRSIECWRQGPGVGSRRGVGACGTRTVDQGANPVFEVEDGVELLCSLAMRDRTGIELIACPTCGRIQVDLFTLVEEVKKTLDKAITVPMKVAVMGCVVNGPGEAEGADVAVFAGNKRGIIYVQGERVANVKEEEKREKGAHGPSA